MTLPRRLGPILVLTTVAAIVAAIGVACGGNDDAAAPPLLGTGSPVQKDAGAPSDAGTLTPFDAGLEASSPATTFRGRLDATLPVKFGGSPYCSYTVSLKEIVIEVAALESGDLIGASVSNLVVEATIPPCPNPPMAPARQTYALTTTTKTASGLTLGFEGAKPNQPATALVIDLVRIGVTYEASVGWHRTDQKPPLDWSVAAKITLAAE